MANSRKHPHLPCKGNEKLTPLDLVLSEVDFCCPFLDSINFLIARVNFFLEWPNSLRIYNSH